MLILIIVCRGLLVNFCCFLFIIWLVKVFIWLSILLILGIMFFLFIIMGRLVWLCRVMCSMDWLFVLLIGVLVNICLMVFCSLYFLVSWSSKWRVLFVIWFLEKFIRIFLNWIENWLKWFGLLVKSCFICMLWACLKWVFSFF